MLDDSSRYTAISEKSAYVCENVPVSYADILRKQNINVDLVQSVSQPLLCFNCLKKPFDDYRVRQALFCAIDVDKLIYNQMCEYANPASCILPTNHPNYHKASDVFSYDPDRARWLLNEAGVPEFSMTLLTNNN